METLTKIYRFLALGAVGHGDWCTQTQLSHASSPDDHKSLCKYMQASNTLYRQVFRCYRNGKHYPVMEDEGKRQNEKRYRERRRERYDSKRIVRKNDHFHTSL
jgi:hypothetical protein